MRTLLLALVAFAGLVAAPAPVSGDGIAFSLTTDAKWTAPANSLYCPGRTYDLVVTVVAVDDEATAAIHANGGPDCIDVWQPMYMTGSWATGWTGHCGSVPAPCVLLDIDPLIPNGQTPLHFQAYNGLSREGWLRLP